MSYFSISQYISYNAAIRSVLTMQTMRMSQSAMCSIIIYLYWFRNKTLSSHRSKFALKLTHLAHTTRRIERKSSNMDEWCEHAVVFTNRLTVFGCQNIRFVFRKQIKFFCVCLRHILPHALHAYRMFYISCAASYHA